MPTSRPTGNLRINSGTRQRLSLALLCLLTLGACASPSHAQLAYPATRKVDVTDTYFGRTYSDPYRWLEDLKSPEVAGWFKAQASMTDGLLDRIPGRDALAKEWAEMDKMQAARYASIDFEGGRYFYKKTLGGEKVGKLYYREGRDGPEKLLFDPSTYKAGVVTTIQSVSPSDDGRYVGMSLSAAGAEWSEERILKVADDSLLPDTIYPTFGILSWAADNNSFFYDAGKVTDTKSIAIQLDRKTRFHVLGTAVAGDRDIFSDEADPELGITPKEFAQAGVDESYPDYIVGNVNTVQREMKLYYAPVTELSKPKITWSVLCETSDDLERGYEFFGDYVYAITAAGAPQFKLVRTSVKHPDWKHAETVLPEAADSIQSIAKSKDFFYITYSNGIVSRIVKYNPANGASSDIKLPMTGDAGIQCPDYLSNLCVVEITSWTQPRTYFDYDADKGTFVKSIFNSDVTYPGFSDLVTEEVEVPGHDGAMIPLSIIHQKNIPMDGSSSCILEGYGAYGLSPYTPFFTVRNSIALHGVVVAYAHVRGGSEKGSAWYRAGFKSTKPNTWKDFISCAEYLEKKGYTSPATLAGSGTSAGGILISRAITERPDLFAAAVCNVGCANAMRMEFSPNGPVNTPEFGTVTNADECADLYTMDGVQHVQANSKYPALMGVAGWNDRRVPAWEPGKFVAAVQNASTSGKPVIMKVNYDNGHFTEDKAVTFKNFAGMDAFMLWQTGHKEFQPVN
jgi:prolyl oligopeptidase